MEVERCCHVSWSGSWIVSGGWMVLALYSGGWVVSSEAEGRFRGIIAGERRRVCGCGDPPGVSDVLRTSLVWRRAQ